MRVLFVGLGSIAWKHIRALKEIDKSVELFALRRESSSKSYPDVRDLYSFSEIPEDISFCIVSNPTSEHRESIQKLIPLGKPLFIEKPVLSNLRGTNELQKMLDDAGLITYVACNLRFHPAVRFLKQAFKIRVPIEYTSYCGSYLPDWHPDQDYRSSYSANKELGGGVHLDLIHEIDMCRYLLGDPEHVVNYFSKKSELEINSYDVAHYMFDFKDTSAFITLNYYRRDSKRYILCIWDDKTWHIDLLENKIVNDRKEIVFHEDYNISDTYLYQLQYFISKLESGEQPMNSFREGLETLKLCLNEK